jgi:hypothetical protein
MLQPSSRIFLILKLVKSHSQLQYVNNVLMTKLEGLAQSIKANVAGIWLVTCQ